MHRQKRLHRRQAVLDVGLVGDDHDDKAGRLEPRDRLLGTGEEGKLLKRGRRDRLAVALEIGVDDAIAIEKDGPYHLVAFFCSFGYGMRQPMKPAEPVTRMEQVCGGAAFIGLLCVKEAR